MLLKNKTAVITGCNRGIGKKILEIFSENGATIFACVRKNDDNFQKLINNLKTKECLIKGTELSSKIIQIIGARI